MIGLLFPQFDSELGLLRTVRLLRPLRTITAVRGMRILVGTLLRGETIAMMGSV